MAEKTDRELLDCPFCGCAAAFVNHSVGMPGTQGYDRWKAVACRHCRATVGASDRRFRSHEDAANAWNLRVPNVQSSNDAKQLYDALQLANDAIRLVISEMTFGDRFTNAGQGLLDVIDPIRDALGAAAAVGEGM